jgi:glutamate dehydrogenase
LLTAVRAAFPPPRSEHAAVFAELLHARTRARYAARLSPAALLEHATGLFELLAGPLEAPRARVRTVRDGARERVYLETVAPDQPFIVDSLREILRSRGHAVLEVLHPILAVERDGSGHVVRVMPPAEGAELVSVVSMEIDNLADAGLEAALAVEAGEVLHEARLVVGDFLPMKERLRAAREELKRRLHETRDPAAAGDLEEAASFLDWLGLANFVFLGYRAYEVRWQDGDADLEVIHGSGLGILRDESRSTFRSPRRLSSLPSDLQARVRSPDPLLIHKTTTESRVLRRTRMDYIGLRRFDRAGRVTGEHRFLGLFTARAYNDLPSDIPILRRKLADILERARIVTGSHDHKEIFSIFTSIPKSELFVTDTDRLAEMIFSILEAGESREVRVSYRPDILERGVSAMVLIPRERFSAAVRVAIEKVLAEAFEGSCVDYRLALSDEPMARLHFYFAARGRTPARPALDELEAMVRATVRSWDERLAEAVLAARGAEDGRRLAERYQNAFPPGYVAEKGLAEALCDIDVVESTIEAGSLRAVLSPAAAGGAHGVLRVASPREPLGLSRLMPVLTHHGLSVIDETTFPVSPRGAAALFLHVLRVTVPEGAPPLVAASCERVAGGILRALGGEVEDDPLNSLLSLSTLDCWEVNILRAYAAYLRQVGHPWRPRSIYAALLENPESARLLVELFRARFEPAIPAARRAEGLEAARRELAASVESVAGLQNDRILRAFENAILATVRTTSYRRAGKVPRGTLAFKIRSADVAAMPDPRPLYEVFVAGPSLEGAHLRSGKVARGGIRWSSRPDDYRTEVLGLMKAQRTKNALIVPVGAKGGFIVKRTPSSPTPAEVREGYELYIRSLLDLTDNVADGRVVHPEGVVVHDEEDPYLVVAADRGTATFSDLANAIAEERGFWLGDAFASGGTSGYDHKGLGITARGAWECVKRHFRELGIDPGQEFTAVGIGDMSGDVFGNGLLLSRHARLLAAFNHAHIFVDPDPDPEASHAERRRLFALARSSWSDYDAKVLSPGGGVFRRDAKRIALSPRARERLGLERSTVDGEELVRAILRMPVDLLWNGGIGTYVKASSESHEEVGDPVNDAVRVDARDVRARVIAEGGNLGCTQLGRIEYARSGGRINTDFIDNSAGVDLSDHEVNLKVLLSARLRSGELERGERDRVLAEASAEVCAAVLRDNRLQSAAISLEERAGTALLDDHRFLADELAAAGLLKPQAERLPDAEAFLKLRTDGAGLSRPEIAVLLAYSKIDACAQVLASSLPDDPVLERFLEEYFPREIAKRFAPELRRHPLRREIVATSAVNLAINVAGPTFLWRLCRRQGAPFDALLRAFLTAWDLAGAAALGERLESALWSTQAAAAPLLDLGLRLRAALERVTLAALRHPDAAGDRPAIDAARRALAADGEPRGAESRGEESGVLADVRAAIGETARLEELVEVAALLRESAVPGERAAAAWRRSGACFLVERVEEEAARIACPTGDDALAREAFTDRLRDARRALARRALAPGAGPIPERHPEADRVLRLLEAARGHEPLSIARLFAIVETLDRGGRAL